MSLLPAWVWLILILPALLIMERWIHRHLQGVWLLLTRDADLALVMYSLVMLPGVLLHEGSHWLAATLLGVRAGRFSVVPERMPNGTLRLGYVETERADAAREAVIGAAPLIAGATAIILVGYGRLGVGPVGDALARGDLLALLAALQAMTHRPDFWLWLYFIFTVANSMLPSASDRRAWLPVAGVLGLAAAVLIYAGFGPALADALAAPVEAATRALAGAFTLTVALNLAFAPFIYGFERLLMRLTGLRVEY